MTENQRTPWIYQGNPFVPEQFAWESAIYVVTNKTDGKKYLGVVLNHNPYDYRPSGVWFKQALKDTGYDNFTFEIVELYPDKRTTFIQEPTYLKLFIGTNYEGWYNAPGHSSTKLGHKGCFMGLYERSLHEELAETFNQWKEKKKKEGFTFELFRNYDWTQSELWFKPGESIQERFGHKVYQIKDGKLTETP